jgi:hypothetical protein
VHYNLNGKLIRRIRASNFIIAEISMSSNLKPLNVSASARMVELVLTGSANAAKGITVLNANMLMVTM